MKINDILKVFNYYAPIEISKEYCQKFDGYDNVGIIVDTDKEITGVLFSLDLTEDAIIKAKENNCNLIFTHHPAIYSPLKNITHDMPIYKAIECGIGVISFHLNLDMAECGIDSHLANGLGANNPVLLENLSNGLGYGRLFDVKNKTLGDILELYKQEFKSERVIIYGNLQDRVYKIASFCGQGLNENTLELANEADLIVSSDVQHHVILKALSQNKKLMIVTHYSSEMYGFSKFYELLSEKLNKIKCVLNLESKYL